MRNVWGKLRSVFPLQGPGFKTEKVPAQGGFKSIETFGVGHAAFNISDGSSAHSILFSSFEKPAAAEQMSFFVRCASAHQHGAPEESKIDR